MSLGALDAALSGLRVSQQQLNVISNNIANVGTEGYTRKILPQSTQAVEGISVAVRGETIIRNVDTTLTRDVWTQISTTSSLDTKVNYLQGIETFHGPPDAEASFAAEIAFLRDSFSALADTPEDAFALSSTVAQAEETANTINEYAELLTTLRNDAQSDLQNSIERVNDLLDQIAELNAQIKFQLNTGRGIAQLSDFRDNAVKQLSEEMEISFFTRGDGVMVIQTLEGLQLADENAEELLFAPVPVSPENGYPNDSVSGIYLHGDPDTVVGGVDLTPRDLGGKIGSLIELRDEILPQYTAQIDELAHKMALRFAAQGLMLFTDADGNIPADTPPDLTTDPYTPVEYIGFASDMQVNADILDDPSLLRSGTYGASVSSGSNEVIFRVLEYTFGTEEYQSAEGTFDLTNVSGTGATLQEYIGVYSENTIASTADLSAYADVNALIAAAGGALDPANDTFRITVNGTDLDISMSNAQLQAGASAADQIVAEINAQTTLAGLNADELYASVSTSGEVVLESRYDLTIDVSSPANAMGSTGLSYLGLTAGSYTATDPYFDIQVGNTPPERITIDQTDTEVELLAKLQAVPGLAVYDFVAGGDGIIRLRPGNDYDDPDFGGALKITSGPFETDDSSAANARAPDAGSPINTVYTAGEQISLLSALFGTYNDPSAAVGDIEDINPVTNNDYQSETYNGSGEYTDFRTLYLGPNANMSTELTGITSIIDFGQKLLNKQIEDLAIEEVRLSDETTFKEALETQLLDESGVNIDEELSNLIVYQNSYNAAARALSAVQDIFDELLSIFR